MLQKFTFPSTVLTSNVDLCSACCLSHIWRSCVILSWSRLFCLFKVAISAIPFTKPGFRFTYKKIRTHGQFKAGFHMIADDRGSQIAESSAIVCDHMETHFCDRLRSSAIICDHLRSFAILRSYGNQSSAICDRNVSHNIFNSDRWFNVSKP